MFNRQRLLILTLSMVLFGTQIPSVLAQDYDAIPIGEGEWAEVGPSVGTGSLAEESEAVAECGNGEIEAGEQCDPNSRSEAAADYCDESCQLIIPDEWTTCFRQEYSHCVRDKADWDGNTHALQPAKKGDFLAEGVRDTETVRPPKIDEDCQEEAILVCEPMEEEVVELPEVEAEPILPEVEETVQGLPGPSFEVSGSGCTLNGVGSTAPSGLIVGWIAASLSLVIRRRR